MERKGILMWEGRRKAGWGRKWHCDWYSFTVPLQTASFQSRFKPQSLLKRKIKREATDWEKMFLIIPNAGKDGSNLNYTWLTGMLNGAAPLEKSLAISYSYLQPSRLTPKYLPKRWRPISTSCMLKFTAALFIITKNWKQPKCLSRDGCGISIWWATTQWLSKASC